jgi:hypothetical protein
MIHMTRCCIQDTASTAVGDPTDLGGRLPLLLLAYRQLDPLAVVAHVRDPRRLHAAPHLVKHQGGEGGGTKGRSRGGQITRFSAFPHITVFSPPPPPLECRYPPHLQLRVSWRVVGVITAVEAQDHRHEPTTVRLWVPQSGG